MWAVLTSIVRKILIYLYTPKKIRKINCQNQQIHPNDQGCTLKSGRRVVLGRGQGPSAAATAAGGRPPSPATAYWPRQTRPENLPWQRRTTHLIEIKYCEDTRPEHQLQAAHAQHGRLRRSIAGDHVLEPTHYRNSPESQSHLFVSY